MTPIPFHGLVSRLNTLTLCLTPFPRLPIFFGAHTHAGSVHPSQIIIHVLPYISVLFNCIWVSSLPLLKPEDMEFVSLLIRQWQGGRVRANSSAGVRPVRLALHKPDRLRCQSLSSSFSLFSSPLYPLTSASLSSRLHFYIPAVTSSPIVVS